ncbi:uncharacterized protein G2W53_039658 [Senna tora]|uniref:Retrotransposon gag domain-containing protein n=1 Tax=Senna tora TaxID=362788 RepID=A0A834STQ0_9FABA|nr:uncharacterized protein G2W53_039658 [Senna tora]
MSVEMPKLKMPGPLHKYDGTTDPDAHIKAYKAAMLYAGATDEVMCREFPSTLKEDAQLWFGELKRSSISSFEDLAEEFSNYFATCKKIRRTTHYLRNVVQDEEKGESLKNFKNYDRRRDDRAQQDDRADRRDDRADRDQRLEWNDRGRNMARIINMISEGIVKGTEAEPQTKKSKREL